jgi:hypothetical protein
LRHPSAAKADFHLIGFIGTTKVVPFQNPWLKRSSALLGHPSAAKADFHLIGFIGTTKVVPFQNRVSD